MDCELCMTNFEDDKQHKLTGRPAESARAGKEEATSPFGPCLETEPLASKAAANSSVAISRFLGRAESTGCPDTGRNASDLCNTCWSSSVPTLLA